MDAGPARLSLWRQMKERERREAEGLVELAEFLTLLRLRAEGAARKAVTHKRP